MINFRASKPIVKGGPGPRPPTQSAPERTTKHFYYSCHSFYCTKSIPSYIVSKHYKQFFCAQKKSTKDVSLLSIFISVIFCQQEARAFVVKLSNHVDRRKLCDWLRVVFSHPSDVTELLQLFDSPV